jgi:hypothetical protein
MTELARTLVERGTNHSIPKALWLVAALTLPLAVLAPVGRLVRMPGRRHRTFYSN